MERSPIATRIESLVQHYHISLKDLAERLDVQRSSLSHILSGRNKPSLDFILKVFQAFPDLNEKWLLHGKGSILKEESLDVDVTRVQEHAVTDVTPPVITSVKEANVTNVNSEAESVKSEDKRLIPSPLKTTGKRIRQIILIYEDNTFETLEPGAQE